MQYRSSITLAILSAVSAAQAAETCPDGNGSNNMNGVDYCCPGTAIGGSGTSISCDIGYTTVPLTQSNYTQIVYGDATTSAGNGGGHHSATPTPIISQTFFPTTMSSIPGQRPTSYSPSTTINIGTPDAPDQTTGAGGSQTSGGDGEDGESSSSSTTTTTTNEDQPGAAARVGAAPIMALAAVIMGVAIL